MSALLSTSITSRVHLRGLTVDLTYTAVTDELDRRASFGLVALPQREPLRTLFALPSDVELQRSILSSRDLRLLRDTPAGAVTLTRTTVTRHLVPAVRVHDITTHGQATLDRIRELSTLRPFSSCTFHSTTQADPASRHEAARLGIGLDDGALPAPARPLTVQRHTPAMWLFHEQAAEALAEAGAL